MLVSHKTTFNNASSFIVTIQSQIACISNCVLEAFFNNNDSNLSVISNISYNHTLQEYQV
jgi:hypothetical protein